MFDDNPDDTVYNKDNFGKVVEKIDLNNLPKMNHTDHKHIWVRDAEETEDYYAMKCNYPKCHRGYLVKKLNDKSQMT